MLESPLNSVFLLQLRNPEEARAAVGLSGMTYEGRTLHIALHKRAIPVKLIGRKGDDEWVSCFIRNLLIECRKTPGRIPYPAIMKGMRE